MAAISLDNFTHSSAAIFLRDTIFVENFRMITRKPLWMSLGSGAVWGVLGLAVGFLFSLPSGRLGHVTLTWAGGIIAAPLIGLLMGQVSRVFGYIEETILRSIVAGASLYAASVLFVMASLLFSSMRVGHLPKDFWTTSFGAAALAFNLTFIVLWPLAYVNHVVVSREWARRGGQATKARAD